MGVNIDNNVSSIFNGSEKNVNTVIADEEMDAHNEIAPHAEQCHLRDVVCLMTIFQEC